MPTPQVDWGTAKPIRSTQVDWGTATPIGPGSTVHTPPTDEPPGLLENLGHALGVGKDESDQRLADIKVHPIRSGIEALGGPAWQFGKGAWEAGKNTFNELEKTGESLGRGNKPEAMVHAINAVPVIGPALNKMADEAPPTHPGQSYASKVWADATPGNVGTAIGTAAQVAPMLEGGMELVNPGREGIMPIPTRAHAGKVFESVMQDAADQPVQLTRSLPRLERAQQLSTRGHGTVSAADNLYKRINTVNPLNYREARDWASGLSRISGEDRMSASPSLQREVKGLSHAFNDDIGDTASSVGRGEDFQKAMTEYRRASQLRDFLRNAGKVAVPLGAGAAGLGAAHKLSKVFTQ